MLKQHKDLLRALITNLRHILLGRYDDGGTCHPGDLDRQLERLGFDRSGNVTPLDALPDPQGWQVRAYRVAEEQLAGLDKEERRQTRREIVEREAEQKRLAEKRAKVLAELEG